MSQKKNTGRDFKIDLDDDNDDPDFQSEDEFENAMETVQSLTLADLLGQSQRRREENYRRQREQRRAETQKNTVTNAGDFFGFYFAFLLIVPKLWHHQSFHITGRSKCIRCPTVFDKAIRAEYEEFIVHDAAKLCYGCFQEQVLEETRLWQEEQRREIGPDWEGLPRKKRMPFKRPISMAPNLTGSSSSSLCAGGGGTSATAKTDIISLAECKGLI
jgi:hypothetical protein